MRKLNGVIIGLEGTKKATVVLNGEFSLKNVPNGTYNLIIFYSMHQLKNINIEVKNGLITNIRASIWGGFNIWDICGIKPDPKNKELSKLYKNAYKNINATEFLPDEMNLKSIVGAADIATFEDAKSDGSDIKGTYPKKDGVKRVDGSDVRGKPTGSSDEPFIVPSESRSSGDDPLVPAPSSSSMKGTSRKSEKKTASADFMEKETLMVAPSTMPKDKTLLPESLPSGAAKNVKAGTLTSGEVNDFRKWNLWRDISDDQLKNHKATWSFNLKDRYTLQLVTQDNRPVIDCDVKLLTDNDEEIWAGRTDNTGKAELWANIYNNETSKGENSYKIVINYNQKKYTINNAKKFQDGINIFKVDDYCNMPNNVDIAFLVDATGSMGDEINYLKVELDDIIAKVKDKHKDKNIRVGCIFYRDVNDEFLVRKNDFESDINKTIGFIDKQSAGGGGDYPEAVEMGMMTAFNELSWSERAITRIVFLIMDAPPHNNPLVIARLKELTAKAALSGIRIVPVACSGSDKSCEYIMRSMALATNGTYVFLTDHSGVGDKHIEPTTDKYEVELMNQLFLRLIDQFTVVPDCSGEQPLAKAGENYNIFNQDEKLIDSSKTENKEILNSINCYPNPTKGDLTIEITKMLDELYVTDITGKLIIKMEKLSEGKTSISLNEYPTGIYFLKYKIESKWGSQKVMLIH